MSDQPAATTPESASGQRPLLLISGGPVTESLWEPLNETYDLAFLYPQSAQTARARGLRAGYLAEVMNADLQELVNNEATLLAARVVNGLPQVQENMQAALGPGSASALGSGLGTWFAGYAHQIIYQQVTLLGLLETVAKSGRHIAGCVVHEDVAPDTRAMVAWSNAHGVPTIHVPHAPCHLLPGVPDIHRETRARYIAASGPAVADFYSKAGHDPDAIRLTGRPDWDGLYGDVPSKAEARATLAIPDQIGPVICYQATWGQTTSLRSNFDQEFDAGWQAVLAVAKTRGAYLIAKVHRHDPAGSREQAYAESMEEAGVAGLATREHFLYVLAAADLVVAQGPSNVCLDAAILGVPSVYIRTEGFDFATALPRRAGAEDIAREIAWELDNPTPRECWDELVARYNSAHPGGDATGQVVAMVKELCP